MKENKFKIFCLNFSYTILIFFMGVICHAYKDTLFKPFKYLFNTPKVSIVMSTYNRAEALPHAIESMLDQTFTDFEFIIIDDGSTDNTSEQIKYYAQKDPRIVHLKNDINRGLIYSLNRGLDIARGEYIVRMDDDDKSLPFRLERQVWAMDINPHIAVLGGGLVPLEGNHPKPYGVPQINNMDEVELNTYFSSGLAHPTIIIRRSFIEKHNIRYDFKYQYAEDCGFYKDVMQKGGRISSMKEGVLMFGYIRGLIKPDKYTEIQSESFKKVQYDKFKPLVEISYDLLGAFNGDEKRCQILKKMVEANKVKKILNQDVLEKRRKITCQPYEIDGTPIQVTHPYWKDTLVLEKDGKSIYRLSDMTETATIIHEDNETVTISWKRWDDEVYSKKSDKQWVYLKNKNGTVKK